MTLDVGQAVLLASRLSSRLRAPTLAPRGSRQECRLRSRTACPTVCVCLFSLASLASAQMLHHDYAEVNDVRLHYAATGKGKLILFLHGFPEFWYEWKDQLAEFGKNYHA